jgi:hypothetical protein
MDDRRESRALILAKPHLGLLFGEPCSRNVDFFLRRRPTVGVVPADVDPIEDIDPLRDSSLLLPSSWGDLAINECRVVTGDRGGVGQLRDPTAFDDGEESQIGGAVAVEDSDAVDVDVNSVLRAGIRTRSSWPWRMRSRMQSVTMMSDSSGQFLITTFPTSCSGGVSTDSCCRAGREWELGSLANRI